MHFFKFLFVSFVFCFCNSSVADICGSIFSSDSFLFSVRSLPEVNTHSDLNLAAVHQAEQRIRKWGIGESPLEQVSLDHFINRQSPLYAKLVSKLNVFVKNETLLTVGSFKLRGALNKLAKLYEEQPEKLKNGVVAASAGNHAQGLAYAGRLFNVPVTIVMPVKTPSIKIKKTLSHNRDGYEGVEVILHGESYDHAFEYAQQLSQKHSKTIVHAFEDKDVIAGQGTIGLEIKRQLHEMGEAAAAVFSAIGGGGKITGLGTALGANVELVGVQSENAQASVEALMYGLRENQRPFQASLADGTNLIKTSGLMLELMRSRVDKVTLVSEELIAQTIKNFYYLGLQTAGKQNNYVLEGAGALSAAGFSNALMDASFQQKVLSHSGTFNVVLVLSGKNIDSTVLDQITELEPQIKAVGM